MITPLRPSTTSSTTPNTHPIAIARIPSTSSSTSNHNVNGHGQGHGDGTSPTPSGSGSGNLLLTKRPSWQPAGAVALTGGVECKRSEGRVLGGGKEDGGKAERGLSSLYVSNEREKRNAAAAAAAASAAALAAAEAKRAKKSWGGTLVNGAMTATVYSAALGLTAYRLWSNRGAKLEDDLGVETSTTDEIPVDERGAKDGDPIAVPLGENGTENEIPPPAYEEASPKALEVDDLSETQTTRSRFETPVPEEDTETWEELDEDDTDEMLVTPSTSTASTVRHRHLRQSSTSANRRVKLPARLVVQRSRTKILPCVDGDDDSDERPEGSISGGTACEEITHSLKDEGIAPTTNDQGVQPPIAIDTPPNLRTEEEDEDLDEMVERLDLMSVRLRGLIEQGQKALMTGAGSDLLSLSISDLEGKGDLKVDELEEAWKRLDRGLGEEVLGFEVEEGEGDGDLSVEMVEDEAMEENETKEETQGGVKDQVRAVIKVGADVTEVGLMVEASQSSHVDSQDDESDDNDDRDLVADNLASSAEETKLSMDSGWDGFQEREDVNDFGLFTEIVPSLVDLPRMEATDIAGPSSTSSDVDLSTTSTAQPLTRSQPPPSTPQKYHPTHETAESQRAPLPMQDPIINPITQSSLSSSTEKPRSHSVVLSASTSSDAFTSTSTSTPNQRTRSTTPFTPTPITSISPLPLPSSTSTSSSTSKYTSKIPIAKSISSRLTPSSSSTSSPPSSSTSSKCSPPPLPPPSSQNRSKNIRPASTSSPTAAGRPAASPTPAGQRLGLQIPKPRSGSGPNNDVPVRRRRSVSTLSASGLGSGSGQESSSSGLGMISFKHSSARIGPETGQTSQSTTEVVVGDESPPGAAAGGTNGTYGRFGESGVAVARPVTPSGTRIPVRKRSSVLP